MASDGIVTLPIMLEEDERVLLVIGRHWLAFWPHFVLLLLTASLPLGIATGLALRSQRVHGSDWRFFAASAVLWLGFWLGRAALAKYRHDHEIWVITDRRLVKAAAHSLFNTSTIVAPLNEIPMVRARVRGLTATMAGFGDVECAEAGALTALNFRRVSHPSEVASLLARACQDVRLERRYEQ
ncbi:MAG: hypothetical protein ACR2PL_02575 [Dehalococcoidia bacterium]